MGKLTEAQARFVELEKFRKAFLDDFDAALQAVAEEVGLGNYFQDKSDGTVYKIVTPNGRWVKFDLVGYVRTRRGDEKQGTLSAKEAQAAGFEVGGNGTT